MVRFAVVCVVFKTLSQLFSCDFMTFHLEQGEENFKLCVIHPEVAVCQAIKI